MTSSAKTAFLARVLEPRPGAYIAIILAVILGSCAYGLRTNGIFSCQASGYGPDGYAAYCQATSYGDYDHGAFWFDLEPAARGAAEEAEVLFLGNSRMQFGFSTQATDDWFSSLSAPYYLLGFSHNGNHTFETPLLRELDPDANVYVLNIDLFFEQSESQPARTVMRDRGARARYEQKRMWQRFHKPICASLSAICGDEIAFFRSRATGSWLATGGNFEDKPVSYDENINQIMLETYTHAGKEFLPHLPADPGCVVATIVPHVETGIETARAIAAALGLDLVAPELDGLNTFDGLHLDPQSAERWSSAFIEAAAPGIRACLDESRDSKHYVGRADHVSH
jgi:hypothetical protein